MSQVQAGTLLVATPALTDPHFLDSVVLLLDIDDDGVLGVVLNHPSRVPVGGALTGWEELVSEPSVLFQGGPVDAESALALGWLRDAADVPVGFRHVVDRLGLVDLDTPRELVEGSLADLRIFAGYAGWGLQQLADEIAEGAWYVVASEPGDPFRPLTETLWTDVLRRQPGDLAWHSTRPADPKLN
jgi:putative transcriptional regulator